MKAKYNLAYRIDLASGDKKEKLWYAVPAGKGSLDEDETAALAVVYTTLSKGEYKHVMEVSSEKRHFRHHRYAGQTTPVVRQQGRRQHRGV